VSHDIEELAHARLGRFGQEVGSITHERHGTGVDGTACCSALSAG
jgi:hypothetical protein